MSKKENLVVISLFIIVLFLKVFSVMLFIHLKQKQTVKTQMIMAEA